jgi:steroid delta-isomerase-like uncharacterized protein
MNVDAEDRGREAARRYFEAWNRRDAAAIVDCFAEGGTYTDPSAGTVAGPAIAGYANGLWAAFPDLELEIVSESATANAVAAQWIMRGTNTGSLAGLPPTGAAIELPGADFIHIEADGIRSVRGYFDQQAIPAQLGLMTVVQPRRVGPFVFGISAAVQSGRRDRPGAFTITSMQVRSEAEAERVRELSRKLAVEMLDMPGFIGWTGATIGDRMVTITAWDRVEDSHQLARNPTHRAAVAEFHREGLGASAFVSSWLRDETRQVWMRCPACQRMMQPESAGGRCTCGSELPEAPPYW